MNSTKTNILNSICLIGIGLWGYLESSSGTAIIPVVFGWALLFCSPGLKKENKVIAHIAVLLTFICLIGLFMPLKGAIGREETLGVFRVSLMIFTSITAMVFFIKSFIANRKAKK
ncbi:MAG: hypothetical protein ACJ0OB_03805 [Flavobacteriaceae bacterium]|tara:strand:+ start:673 stop:1017 length:345 start_codon:yes stop_codon:yes gene_type:complete